MNKSLFFVGAFICWGVIGSAGAAVKCVALATGMTCEAYPSGFTGKSDWSANCTMNVTGGVVKTTIQGIAMCSDQVGGRVGATSDTLTTNTDVERNAWCWCKMVSPAVSKWVAYSASNGLANCDSQCAYNCANAIRSNQNFQTGMFNNLIN